VKAIGLFQLRNQHQDQKKAKKKRHCTVCGREVDQEEYDDYDGMCWECWDNQLTEESDMMFEDVM